MATKAHCAFAFEALCATFDHREPLGLALVEELWEEYHGQSVKDGTATDGGGATRGEDDTELTNGGLDGESESEPAARPAAVSRLQNPSRSSSSTSVPSTLSAVSSLSTPSTQSTGTSTPASSKSSSRSSLLSFNKRAKQAETPSAKKYPLFVTWNTVSRTGRLSLRGCIGTFDAQELEHGLRSYALTSAFEDHRFSPISASQLPSLHVSITLLHSFATLPSSTPLAWEIGVHGLRISFTYHGRRYGSTYLPQVAEEQEWTKEETMISLMRKAGWSGRKEEWSKVSNLEVVTYQGKAVGLGYDEYKEWRSWVHDLASTEDSLK
ncbi:hypothetical protein LTR66_010046 [Elasticomyces elasticus]|nr:hypothetical protein LTR66_010046 [Elasticomyces elasticus]